MTRPVRTVFPLAKKLNSVFGTLTLLPLVVLSACGSMDQAQGKVGTNPDIFKGDPLAHIPAPFRQWIFQSESEDLNLKKDLSEFLMGAQFVDGAGQPSQEALGVSLFGPNKSVKLQSPEGRGEEWLEGLVADASIAVGNTVLTLAWRAESAGDLETLQLFAGSYPVAGAQVRAERNSRGKRVYAQGNVPSLLLRTAEHGTPATFEMSRHVLSPEEARIAFARELNFHPSRIGFPEAEVVAANGKWIPTYKSWIESDILGLGRGPAFPLEVTLDARDGRLLEQRAVKIHFDADALVFPENFIVNESQGPQSLKIKNLLDPGDRLISNLFKVWTCNQKEPSSTNCTQQAIAPTPGDFTAFAFEDPRYDEVVAYYTLDRSMNWYRGLMSFKPTPTTAWGSGYPGSRNDFGLTDSFGIDVNVRAMTRATTPILGLSNAAYLPSSLKGNTRPQIVIGTGWEEGMPDETKYPLRYLGKDSDVVMHEFGHHMVFRTLRDVRGEGGAMHEGFADYFTYAITGNNLLAESIVPSNRTSLRGGDKTGDVVSFISEKPHISGELWSSALWKVRVQLGGWQTGYLAFDKIVWEAVDLLKFDADYYDAISALAKSADSFAAQEKKSAKAIKEKMFQVFHEYGYLDKPKGDGSLPNQSPRYLAATGQTQRNLQDPGKTSLSNDDDKSDKAWYECGSVAAKSSSGKGVSTFWMLILLLPLALPKGLAQGAKVLQRVKRKSRI